MNSNLNISEINNDNVVIKDIETKPLYNLVYQPYNSRDCYIISNNEYSIESDWTQLLKKVKFTSKYQIAKKLLHLQERKWNKENILQSDIIKDNRDHLDSFLLLKYLNSRIKLQEHFNWLVWAIATYYFSLLLAEDCTEKFQTFHSEEIGLPGVDTLDWYVNFLTRLNGFEWKGLFIRVQTEEESKNLFREVKSLNYLFFEYIQLIETYKTKIESGPSTLLSNELIFPLISYVKHNGLVVMATACIYKYNYDISIIENLPNFNIEKNKEINLNNYNTVAGNDRIFNSNMNEPNIQKPTQPFSKPSNNLLFSQIVTPSLGIENPLLRHQIKGNMFISQNFKDNCNTDLKASFKATNKTTLKDLSVPKDKPPQKTNVIIKQQYTSENAHHRKSSAYTLNNPTGKIETKVNESNITINLKKSNNAVNKLHNISKIPQNESFHSLNVSQNINHDVNTEGYSREDLNRSPLFNRLRDRNLIKVIDDLNESYNLENNNHKFKFLIFSAEELIPNLIDADELYNHLLILEDEKSGMLMFNEKNFDECFNEKNNDKAFAALKSTRSKDDKKCFKITNEIIQRIAAPVNGSIVTNSIKDLRELKESKSSLMSFKNKNIVEENEKDFDYECYENSLSGIKFKIFYSKNDPKSKKNSRINDYLLNIYSKQIPMSEEKRKLLAGLNSEPYLKFAKRYFENPDKPIKGRSVLSYGLRSNVKQKYSLIKHGINSKPSAKLVFDLLNNLARALDSHINIDNSATIDNFFHRYGINKSFDLLILTKMKNPIVADVLKMSLLCRLIRKVLFFSEGHNTELKIMMINLMINSPLSKEIPSFMMESGFSSISEKCLQNIFNQKVFYVISSILYLTSSDNEFSKYLFEQLNFFLFVKLAKTKLLSEIYEFSFDWENKFCCESLLPDLIQVANKKPFLFLSMLETELNFTIEPFVKFKASVSRENFLQEFRSFHLIENDLVAQSFIRITEVSYYLLAKCIFTANTSKKLDSLKDYKDRNSNSNSYIDSNQGKKQPTIYTNAQRGIYSRNSKETKPTTTLETSHNKEPEFNIVAPQELNARINLRNGEIKQGMFKVGNTQDKAYIISGIPVPNKENDLKLPKLNNPNLKINSNNITKINNLNIRYTDHKSALNESKSKSSDIRKKIQEKVTPAEMFGEIEEELDSSIKDKISVLDEFEFPIPAILYKLAFADEDPLEAKQRGNYGVYKFLRNRYIINKIDIVKDWKSQLEMLLNDSVSLDCSESIILNLYIVMFLHYLFVEADNSNAKEVLYRIKEWLKSHALYQPEQLAVINLLEGMLTEKRNYVESEEYFTKSIIFSLLLYGDPRGRGNNGKIFLLYPIWKICRQTCILENSLVHENFKELFYAQDNYIKNLIESGLSTLYENEKLYFNNEDFKEFAGNEDNRSKLPLKNLPAKNQIRRNPSIQKNSLDISEININIEENVEEKYENISKEKQRILFSDNYDFFRLKYFPFPSISDVKTSYNTYFASEKFVSFFMKNLPILFSSNRIWNDDTLKNLNLHIYTAMNSSDIYTNNSRMHTNSSQKSKNIKKGEIFSSFMYDTLLERLSFKKCPPKGIVLTWGNNSHNETSHNNYEKMYLPRICFKIKEEEILSVKSGWEFNLALSKEKQIYAWGNNEAGQCGVDFLSQVIFNPTKIESLNKVKMISCGNEHALALDESNHVYSWGKGSGGVLGFPEETNLYKPKKIDNFTAESISSGSLHNAAIGKDGSLYTWGCLEGGQLGHSEQFLVSNAKIGFISCPTKVEGLKNTKVVKVSCGEAHTLALTYDNKVYGWGFTSNGQLGMGFCADSFEIGLGMANSRILEPKHLKFSKIKIADIQCGKTFSTFITEKNELLVCGVNDLSQLGIEQPTSVDHLYYKDELNSKCYDVVFPMFVECFVGMRVKRVACGESHCLALIEDQSSNTQTLWSWGSNRFGQLGQGNQFKTSLPKPVNFLLGQMVIDIACGAFHSICVISNDIEILDSKDNMSKIKYELNEIGARWKTL